MQSKPVVEGIQGLRVSGVEDKSVSLTLQEKEIAKKIGFDENVLKLIKERLHPEMGIVKSGGLEPPDMEFVRPDDTGPAPLLEIDRKNYEKLAKQFPELEELIKAALMTSEPLRESQALQAIKDSAENRMKVELGPEKYKRYQHFVAETAPYMLLVRQKMEESSGHKGGVLFLNPSEFLDSDKAPEKAIIDLKASVAGNTLKPENRGIEYLGLRYKGVGDTTFSQDRRVTLLRPELEGMGYRITEDLIGISHSKQFESKAEAEKYLRDSGTAIDGISLREQTAESKQVTYPPDEALDPTSLDSKKRQSMQSMPFLGTLSPEQMKQMEKVFGIGSATGGLSKLFMPSVRIMPGATVKKLGERQYLVDTPARYIATAVTRVATVVKVPAQQAGFELVRVKRTNGLNYSLENEKIIEKLKYWDAKYGVTVLEAREDGLVIRFKDLPEDLSNLCTEMFLFCPRMELHENENSNAAAMRKFAKSLRETKTANFWWD